MAARVVTVAQQKGGAGKTTLAAHLAVAWLMAGRRVAVVDIDPQASLSRWYEMRAGAREGATGLTHVQIAGWRTQREIERLLPGHDVVVIDSPPHAETDARIAVRAAHLLLVPVQPSPLDLWATRPTLDLGLAEKVPAALLVFNRVPARSRLADELAERAAGLGAGVAASRIGNRTGLASAMMMGAGITETEPRSRAAAEISALAEELLGRAG